MLVHIKDLIKDAEKKKYAVGAFNTQNLETTIAIVKAAVAKITSYHSSFRNYH